MNTTVFYILLFTHLTSLIIGFGSVMVIDAFGLLWLLKKRTLAEVNRVADVSQRIIWVGWIGLVLSGSGLIWLKGYVDNLTQIKLFFVLMLGINGFFLHLVKKMIEPYEKQNDVPRVIKFRIGLTSVISQTGWWGAMAIGFMHRQWQHTINWPDEPWLVMAAWVGLLLVAWLVGEVALKKANE